MSTISRMLRSAAGLALAALAAGCVSGAGERAAGTGEAVDEEPFALMIDAGRAEILIERARDGLAGAESPARQSEPSELQSATRSLRRAAAQLYALREEACESGHVGAEHCGALPPPAWLGERADAVADIREIRRRIEWLQTAMEPFVTAGCEAGQARQKDEEEPPFCSVE
jgi:hypothetical protein